MISKQLLLVGMLGSVLIACGTAPRENESVPPNKIVYTAQDIPNRQINFIWIELPTSLNMGSNEARVFMARTDPPGMLIPTETELPCITLSEEEYLDLRPVTMPFEFDGKQIAGSYSWQACATCIECYMDWETTMEIVGTLEQDRMDLGIGIRHMGHNIQDDYLQIGLWPERPSSKEPSIQCRRSNDCKDFEFVPRQ